jgi:dephospho-CoA kinase
MPDEVRRPFVLGVTGNIASGKSTVTAELERLGATVFDADAIYHELIAPGQPLLGRIRDRFGDEVINPDGSLNRRALGAIVFSDPEQLAALDRLTHPAVMAETDRRAAAAATPVAVIDAVKLIESGHADHCDQVRLVTARADQQVTRLSKSNRLSKDEAKSRVAAQPPLAEKCQRADVVIDNSGSIAETQAQVYAHWAALPLHARTAPVGPERNRDS